MTGHQPEESLQRKLIVHVIPPSPDLTAGGLRLMTRTAKIGSAQAGRQPHYSSSQVSALKSNRTSFSR
jgi:hypothetical protein